MREDPTETNQRLWDEWAEAHEKTAFYDVAGFLAGGSSLTRIERETVGDVAGRSLLHLQCHFGLDTLSWARLGARVTGIDFSERAIATARRLARRAGLEARFIQSRVEDAAALLDETFDIVFTSYGVLPWLPSLKPWAELIARCLAPGGRFHLIEFHPFFDMLHDDGRTLHHDYFNRGEPVRTEERGSYATRGVGKTLVQYTWAHPLSEVMTSLVDAGLRVDRFSEFDFVPIDLGPPFVPRASGEWVIEGLEGRIPLVYALEASHAVTPA